MMGFPVLLDAARFGSYAHRLRNFWQNLLPANTLRAVCGCALRPEGLQVYDILGPNRHPAPVKGTEPPPYYPCNRPGQP
jgi:hypothetical protein